MNKDLWKEYFGPLQISVGCPRCEHPIYFSMPTKKYSWVDRDAVWVKTGEPEALCFSCGLAFTFDQYAMKLVSNHFPSKLERTN